ncbi:MAG: ABC transporter permease subunit [Chlorobiaceae bacterium]|nr:ABC transporter permease subunit [Chlorobiaceae bacterium]
MRHYFSIISGDGMTASLMLTVETSLVTLLLHLAAGISAGYFFTCKRNLVISVADTIITLPLVFPPIATGFLLLMLLGRNGVIGAPLSAVGQEIIFSKSGVFIASFIAGLPLVCKSVQAAVEGMNPSLVEAAWTLGKNRFQTYRSVVLPTISRALIAGLILSMGRSLGEVGITLILGGNIIGKTETVSLAVYNAVFEGNFEKAAVLSLMLGVVSILLFYALRKFSRS